MSFTVTSQAAFTLSGMRWLSREKHARDRAKLKRTKGISGIKPPGKSSDPSFESDRRVVEAHLTQMDEEAYLEHRELHDKLGAVPHGR
ncbi:MAG: hypothetical protein SWK76_09295 [Actinomycetota bacterium]|nr:hypothetical protein [Actinomycetota bacterium]